MSESEKPHPSESLKFDTVPINLVERPRLRADDDQILSFDGSAPSIRSSPSGYEIYQNLSSEIPEFSSLVQESEAATTAEQKMTFTGALNLYPKAIGWSILLSLTIVMEGFDLTLINSFYAFPSFKRRFGELINGSDYEITPEWQSAIAGSGFVGEVLGLLLNGLLTARLGNRYTMILALGLLSTFVLLSFFAQNTGMLLASQLLSGIPWGVFQTLTTTYAMEVMPIILRAYLTSTINLCWLVGQVICSGLLRAFTFDMSEWSYRIPFALQWVWAVPILIAVLFAPESPWWLVQHERIEEAKRSLLRLTRKGEGFQVDEHIAMMKHTNVVEEYLGSGVSYRDCFKGVDLRRTEIACMVWATQAICGTMTGYATYFYVEAGLNTDSAFDLTLAMYCSGIVGTLLSWFLMQVAGRRTIYLYGNAVCSILLLTAGIFGALPPSSTVSWAIGSLMVLNTFCYDLTLGPVCYCLVAEIPSTRLRVKTVVLARVTYNAISIATNTLLPRMLNPTAGDWKGKACLPFAGLGALCCVWCYYRLPEPKGLTFMELDLLFERNAPARKFRDFKIQLEEKGYFDLVWGKKAEWVEGRRVRRSNS